MQIVSQGDNLYEMSNPVKKIVEYIVCWNFYPAL